MSLWNFWRLEKIFENYIDKRRQFNHKYHVSFSASVGIHIQGTFIELRVFLFTMNEAAEAGHGSYQRISCVIPAIMHVTLSSTCSTCRGSHSSSCCRAIICDRRSSRAWISMIIRYSILWSQFHFIVENVEKREKSQLLFFFSKVACRWRFANDVSSRFYQHFMWFCPTNSIFNNHSIRDAVYGMSSNMKKYFFFKLRQLQRILFQICIYYILLLYIVLC